MITSEAIENAIYNLCVSANTVLPDSVFEKILEAYEQETNVDAKNALDLILKNAKMASVDKKPLCQDTGQVLVFAKIGENSNPEKLNQSINAGVKRAYKDNFYRKSIVKNAIFERINTENNTPAVIYTELVEGDQIEFSILIKGAGSENMSAVKMLTPTASQEEIIDAVVTIVQNSGAKACPPLFIGVGIGGTMDYSAVLSKKALLQQSDIDEEHKDLSKKILDKINDLKIGPAGFGGKFSALDVKILSDFTHIACMPVSVSLNCHSSRHSRCVISKDGIEYFNPSKIYEYEPMEVESSISKRVNTSDIEAMKNLQIREKVLLSGEIFTARDAAHKRLFEMIKHNEKLPFDLNGKTIFYAGPCPCNESEIVGSIGPTTSSRMDKFAPLLYESGVLATIGKGARSIEVQKTVKQVGGLYFTVIGGIACYLSKKFVKKEIVAFEDLGPEAIYRFEVLDMPVCVDLK